MPLESWSVLTLLRENQNWVIPPTTGHPKCRVDVGNQNAFSSQQGEMGRVGATPGIALVCTPTLEKRDDMEYF